MSDPTAPSPTTESAPPAADSTSVSGGQPRIPRRESNWQGPAIFLLIIVGLAWAFLPGQHAWLKTSDERWQHGIQAAREMWQLARVYRELNDGTLPGLTTGTIGELADILNWDMPYFEERLRWFSPDDFVFAEVDPVEGTFRIRLEGSLPDSPPGVYTIDQDREESLEGAGEAVNPLAPRPFP